MVRLSGFLAALQFLTRVPLRLRREPQISAAVPWFPIVGVVVGAVVGGIGAGLWHVIPAGVAAAVAVLAGVLLTGAFHEDGLADVADAFAGGWSVEQRLRILDDPLHGSYGVAALCGSIVLRIVAAAGLAAHGPAVLFAGMVAAHALARTVAVVAMVTVRPAKAEGIGVDAARSVRHDAAARGVIVGLGLSVVAVGWWAAPLAGAAAIGAGAVVWLARRKIGGVTGDVLGAVEQVAECLVLVTATGLAAEWLLWWS